MSRAMNWPDDIWETELNYSYLKAKGAAEDAQLFLADRQLGNLLTRSSYCNYARDQAALIELLRLHKHGECVDILLPMLSHRGWVELGPTPSEHAFEHGDDVISLSVKGEGIVAANLAHENIRDEIYAGVAKFEDAMHAIKYSYPHARCVRTLTSILTFEDKLARQSAEAITAKFSRSKRS